MSYLKKKCIFAVRKKFVHQKYTIMKKIFTFFAAMTLLMCTYAQLPDGSIVPNATLYEINKTTGAIVTDQPIVMYNLLNDHKTVFLDVSATWCPPCWDFHNTGTLESLWNNYGPNSSVNDSYVMYIEGDAGNFASLSGTGPDADGSSSQGNWLAGVDYPVVPLNMAPNNAIQNSFMSGYGNINSLPTLFMVCPNRMSFEVSRSGTGVNDANNWHNGIAQKCPVTTNVNDAVLGLQKSSNNLYYCSYDFVPQVMLQNVGTAPLTSATLRLTHGSDIQTVNWSGNLSQYSTEMVQFPAITGSENGTHNFTIEIVDVNGVSDEGPLYNTHTETFNAQISSNLATSSQIFTSTTLDPWVLNDNTDGYCYVYQGALLFNAYSISNGKTAELIAPMLNLTLNDNPTLSFDYCYYRYNNNSNERMRVMISTDCGEHWNSVFDKSGATLATGSNTTSNYVANNYQHEVVDLSEYVNEDRVLLKFAFTSTYGNNIWLDNVYIANSPLAIETVESSNLSIFPNPVKDVLTINYDKAISQIYVYDVNGKLVKTITTVDNTINVSDLSEGVYMLNIQTEEGLIVRKIVKE